MASSQQLDLLQKKESHCEENIYLDDNKNKRGDELMQLIASRFVLARKLSGFKNVKDAIVKMGLKNEKVIMQIEHCHRMPTLSFVIRAANAYGVSADYLLGLSEDDDRSSDIAMRAAIFRQNKQLTDMLLTTLSNTTYHYAKTIGDSSVKQLAELTEKLHQNFNRFCELNPDFEDMRGGAPILNTIKALPPLLKSIKKRIAEKEYLISLHNQQLEHLMQQKLQLIEVENG